MLSYSSINNSSNFTMQVKYTKDILIYFSDIFEFFKNNKFNKKLIFIDPIVLANNDFFLELEILDSSLILVPTNLIESNKDIVSLTSILEIMEANGIGRREEIVCAIGGGALLDVVSFAASIFRRGIKVVKVPTTLLGIVDASIGIKTGINFLNNRNRLGSYHFDYTVIVSPNLLKGLHKSFVRQGLGEIFKIAIIKSKKLFDHIVLYKNELEKIEFYDTNEGRFVIKESINLMLEELHNNPREDILKRCVDFGHSFSPLVEMESIRRVGSKTLPHGYAVAYDCILTTTISLERGLLSNQDYLNILSLYLDFDFNFDNEIYKDYNLLWASFLEITKHRGGFQNLPLPTSIGFYTFIQDLTFEEMKNSALKLNKLIYK